MPGSNCTRGAHENNSYWRGGGSRHRVHTVRCGGTGSGRSCCATAVWQRYLCRLFGLHERPDVKFQLMHRVRRPEPYTTGSTASTLYTTTGYKMRRYRLLEPRYERHPVVTGID